MIIVVEKLCRTHHNKNSSLLNFLKFGSPGRAGEMICSICVSLMKNPAGVIAKHHTLEAVSKSQPLKHNGERALTPAVHCQIRPAITVFKNEYTQFQKSKQLSIHPVSKFKTALRVAVCRFGHSRQLARLDVMFVMLCFEIYRFCRHLLRYFYGLCSKFVTISSLV